MLNQKFLSAAFRFSIGVLLLLFSQAILNEAYAQSTNNLDSLSYVISKNGNYKDVIGAYKKLAQQQCFQQFNKVNLTADKGIAFASKQADSISIGELISSKGNAQYFKGSYDSAARYFITSIKILESKNADNALGEVYNNLARLYRKTKQYQRALFNYNLALTHFKATGDLSGEATILNESGVVFEDQQKYTEALKRYKASLKIKQQLHDEVGIGYSYSFIGGLYALIHDNEKAEDYQLKALAIRTKLKDEFALALNYSDLASMYLGETDYTKARENFLKSNIMANKISYLELLSSNYKSLADLESKTGNYKQAYTYNNKYGILRDSIFKTESIKQVNELSAQFETEKKEQQISLLSKQSTIQQLQLSKRNIIIVLIASGFILFIIISYLFYNRYKLTQETVLKTAVIQQQDLASKRIIDAEEAERKRIAADLHDGVGQLFSAVKMNLEVLVDRFVAKQPDALTLAEKTLALVDESCTEVRSIAHQMMPNALIKNNLVSALQDFVNKIPTDLLKISIETAGITEKLDSSIQTMLYRVIQESVNNVLKHAKATMLDIVLLADNQEITVTIEDDGKGFDTTDKGKFSGIGLKNMVSRIEYLKGTVDVSSSPGKGTLVAIYVPIG